MNPTATPSLTIDTHRTTGATTGKHAPSPTTVLTNKIVPFKQSCVIILKGMVQLYPVLLLDEPCLESNYSPTVHTPLSGYAPQLALPHLNEQLRACLALANSISMYLVSMAPISELALQRLHTSAEATVVEFKNVHAESGLPDGGAKAALSFIRTFGEFATCLLELTDSFANTGLLLTTVERAQTAVERTSAAPATPTERLPEVARSSPFRVQSPSTPPPAPAPVKAPEKLPLSIRNPYLNEPVFPARYRHEFGLTRVDLVGEYDNTCGVCNLGFRLLEKKVVCKDCKLTLHESCHEHGHPETIACGVYNSPENKPSVDQRKSFRFYF